MKQWMFFFAMSWAIVGSGFAEDNAVLEKEIAQLRQQTLALQTRLNHLQNKLTDDKPAEAPKKRAGRNLEQPKTAPTLPKRPGDQPARTQSTAPNPSSLVSIEDHTTHSLTAIAHSVDTPKTPEEARAAAKTPRLTTERAAGTDGETEPFHSTIVSVHTLKKTKQSKEDSAKSAVVYPTALVADGRVITYIAGTPVVSAPFLGERPAFDGSDYIVNISSINRDQRLMQQRRKLYHAYEQIGYPDPNRPILALSGKVVPDATFNQSFYGANSSDINLGETELDVAAALSSTVEGFIGIVYDNAPPSVGGQRVSNSAFGLSLGFINIGNLDKSPFYFTAGQLYAPFGRYSTSMVSGTLPMLVGRTLTRPIIFGYQSRGNAGFYAQGFGYESDTTEGSSAAGGFNVGYSIDRGLVNADLGVSYISTLADSLGMQSNNLSSPEFGGFAAPGNGSETVAKTPGVDLHATLSLDRYNFTAEWLDATQAFRPQDLSYNGYGAQPQAGQLEASVTFVVFDRPATVGAGYQWTNQALALNIPAKRGIGVFNISIWRNTVESLEYRYDIDYGANKFANGAGGTQDMYGTGKSANSVTAQIGVYF